MGPVLGLTSACMQSTIVFYDILSALFFNLCTYAALIYDCSSVLHIKESVEHLYDDWDSLRKLSPHHLGAPFPHRITSCSLRNVPQAILRRN